MRRTAKASRRDAATVLSDSTRAKRRKERMSRNEQRGELLSNNCFTNWINVHDYTNLYYLYFATIYDIANEETNRIPRRQEILRKKDEEKNGSQFSSETENILNSITHNGHEEENDDDNVNERDNFVHRSYYEENQQGFYYPRNIAGSNVLPKVSPSPESQAVDNIKLTLSKDYIHPLNLEDGDSLLKSGKDKINTVAIQNDARNAEIISTVTEEKSFESNLHSKSHEELIEMVMKMRKRKNQDNEDIEEINEMTVNEVFKCAKNDLFKRMQFIRHQSVLREYQKKGSIGRFVMRKLKIKKNRRKIFWNTYFSYVRKGIKSQRNIIHTNIRRKFLGKFNNFLKFVMLYEY